MARPIPRDAYDGLQDEISDSGGVALNPKEIPLTKQSEKDSCDINQILKRYERTGSLPDLIRSDGHFADYSEVLDYQEACELIRHAEYQFAALDAPIRNRFANDPGNFLAFATDPRNREEMGKLGLLKESPAPGPEAPPAVAPGSPAAAGGGNKQPS